MSSRPIPLQNQTLRVTLEFFDATTRLPYNGTLSNLTFQVSKDTGSGFGSFASSTNTPVQVGTSRLAYCNLTTTEMNAAGVSVYGTADNAITQVKDFCPTLTGSDIPVQVAGMNNSTIGNATFASGTSIHIDTQKVANNNGSLVLANTTIGTASAVTGNVSLSNTTLSNIANTTFDLANSMGTGWTLRKTISAIGGAVGLSGSLTHASGTSVVFAALDGTSYTLTVAASSHDAPSKLMNRTAIA